MKVVIIGGGLGGLTAARILSEHAGIQVTIIERGREYAERLRESSPDLLSGLGGAGTVFGGKLCLPPASGSIWSKTNTNLSEFPQMLRQIFGTLPTQNSCAVKEVPLLPGGIWEKIYPSQYVSKDRMSTCLKTLLGILRRNSVDIRTNCEFLGVREGNKRKVVTVKEQKQIYSLPTDVLILATGRSSSRKISTWFDDKDVLPQCPDLGIRLSLDLAKNPAFHTIGIDRKFKVNYGGTTVRTFCVCAGGEKALVDWDTVQYYDGHFGSHRTSIVNLGILARTPHVQGVQAAWEYCYDMRRYLHANLSLHDFLHCGDTLTKNNSYNKIFEDLRLFITNLYNIGVIKQNPSEVAVHLPSVDNLNPIIKTDAHFETSRPGVYVIGDAAGISRGFVQAAWSGYCAATAIAAACASPERSLTAL